VTARDYALVDAKVNGQVARAIRAGRAGERFGQGVQAGLDGIDPSLDCIHCPYRTTDRRPGQG
jgi:hypothetical protein